MDLTLTGIAPLTAPSAPAPFVAAPAPTNAPAAPEPNPTVAALAPATPDLQAEENAIVEKLDGLVGNQVRFRVDLDTDRAILQITDPETGEVVNSIPSEEMLAVMERLEEARCHLIDCAV
ncbi:MAG: flagellar protein FlaG [Planctomycetes bacterium]|nr:flagellar protein FlaG [Planctomycetota bacterium]